MHRSPTEIQRTTTILTYKEHAVYIVGVQRGQDLDRARQAGVVESRLAGTSITRPGTK